MKPNPSRKNRRAALAPAFVVTLSAVSLSAVSLVVAACSDSDGATNDRGGAVQTAGAAGTTAGGSGGSSDAGSGGTSPLGGSGGSTPAGGSAGAAPNDPACPAAAPLMNDPCGGELLCDYGELCGTRATCKQGRWKLSTVPGGGACNPPAACPEDEPADPIGDACTQAGLWGAQECRFARSTCFQYLQCGSTNTNVGRWNATNAGKADACCPATRPTVGSACTEEDVLCAWPDDAGPKLSCQGGHWVDAAVTGCAAGIAPKMNDACATETSCVVPYNGACNSVFTCEDDVWRMKVESNGAIGCDAPPVCPTEEPTAPEDATSCEYSGFGGSLACRYPHGTCARYMQCGALPSAGGELRWQAPFLPFVAETDSCCPSGRPILGTACTDEHLLCAYQDTSTPPKADQIVCKGGVWTAR